jgi:hypothetical protein
MGGNIGCDFKKIHFQITVLSIIERQVSSKISLKDHSPPPHYHKFHSKKIQ